MNIHLLNIGYNISDKVTDSYTCNGQSPNSIDIIVRGRKFISRL